jgi:hypothetical protein
VDVSLVISIIAIIIAIASAVFTGISARADHGMLKIERQRRLDERHPRITTKLDGMGTKRILNITLDSPEPLAMLDVEIAESHFYRASGELGGWDCEFNPRAYGVEVPEPGRPALRAYSYNVRNGEPAGLSQHDSISWAMNTKKRLEWVKLKVTCQGPEKDARWVYVFSVDAQPEIEDTIA